MPRVPSASTITDILRRYGCLDGPGVGETRHWTRFEHAEPNDLWQMDFKGHFAMRTGRCHPLTVLDDHSRYSLTIDACDNERTATVQAHLEKLFERHGLPRRILTDNGSPWGTWGSSERHTVLTVWLMDRGVMVVHGRPYHRQTRGKDERFHRTLKSEVLDGRIFETLTQAQTAFEEWRHVYNTRRPHEALGLATPATRYRPSPRSMSHRIAPPEYEPQAQVRKVRANGRPDSIVYTDSFRFYDVLDVSEFHHHRINHSELFAHAHNHINGIENFWNQAKRHLRGYNGIPKAHFHLFLKECEWRFNHRPKSNLLSMLRKWAKV